MRILQLTRLIINCSRDMRKDIDQIINKFEDLETEQENDHKVSTALHNEV